jgi:hypothetical protein
MGSPKENKEILIRRNSPGLAASVSESFSSGGETIYSNLEGIH